MTTEQLAAIVGNYECHVYDKGGKSDWHYVIISKVNDTTLKWATRAGPIWTLTVTADPTKLAVGSDCPYYSRGHTEATVDWQGEQVTGLLSQHPPGGPGGELYTRTTDFTDTKYGLEALDLSGAVVLNSEHLQMAGQSSASYRQDFSCWEINSQGGYIDFTYNMGDARDITLSLLLCSVVNNNVMNGPIKITWNDHIVVDRFDPHICDFYNKGWFVEAGRTNAGVNKIRIQLVPGSTTQVFLRKLSVSDFKMQVQQQNMWCWDATGVSVADCALRYRNHWVQCEMYNAVKGTKNACTYADRSLGKESPYNQSGWPENSLGKAGVLGASIGDPATWDDVVGQLAVACPVVCVVWWREGGGHDVAITGAYVTGDGSAEARFVVIDDCWSGHSAMTYETFKSNYQHSGYWQETRFTTLGSVAKTP